MVIDMKHPETGLTYKQQLFIDIYEGDGVAAATLAGYANPSVAASRMFKNPVVVAALDARDNNKHQKLIATREERQAFWSTVMRDKKEAMPNRLKAAESLGRSEADFIDRMSLEIDLGEELKQLSDAEIMRKIKQIEDTGVIDMIKNRDGEFSNNEGVN